MNFTFQSFDVAFQTEIGDKAVFCLAGIKRYPTTEIFLGTRYPRL